MTVTHFWDMHSGGRQKLDWGHIYIEAPEEEARSVFYSRFDRNPERVTCTCCGSDYSISESEDIFQATGYHRHCAYDRDTDKYIEEQGRDKFTHGKYLTIEEYLKGDNILFIRDKEIKPHERNQEVPPEGFVWV